MNFITERAPWWGEFLEWLVKGIKTPLKKVLDWSTLCFEELQTVLVEVNGTVLKSLRREKGGWASSGQVGSGQKVQ